MTYICNYCKTEFTAKRSLSRHINTAKFCLDIQKSQGIDINIETYKCNCGYECTVKDNFNRHQKKCNHILNQVLGNNNNITNNTINNTINSNNTYNVTQNITFNYSLSNLTTKSITAILKPLLTRDIIELGMPAITDIVIDEILQKDGQLCYRCTDRSRKKFMMLVDDKGTIIEKIDSQANTLRNIIHLPLIVLTDKYINDDNHDVKNTAKQILELNRDGKEFINELSYKLPSEYEDRVVQELTNKFRKEEEEFLKEIEKEREKEQNKIKKDQKCKESKYFIDLFNRSDVRKDLTTWWDPVEYFAYEWIYGSENDKGDKIRVKFHDGMKILSGIILRGYSNEVNSKIIDFGTKELKKIENLGLTKYLDQKYIR